MDSDNLKEENNKRKLICLPGQRLCLSEENVIGGQGTNERHGYIYSTLAGLVQIKTEKNTKIIEVISSGNLTLIPMAGDIVTARVTQINQRLAKCMIICVRDHILTRVYKAILRKEDVRATEKDKVEIYKSFRPGDIILARVLPQAELNFYQLSTAENELGVVIAHASESGPYGPPMVPISWTQMQCPETLVKETRKVAKVVPESSIKIEENENIT